jgi:uncharacterized membrane protein (DUF2068 family)
MTIINLVRPLKSKDKKQYKRSNHFTRVIAAGRLLYGLVLLGLGLTIFELIGKNLTAGLLGLVHKWNVDAHLYYVHWVLQKVSTVSNTFLIILTVVNFIYASLAFVEAAGLALGRRWAYWLVIWDTASFIPIEACQLFKEFGWVNFILFLYYLTTVIYLLFELKRIPKQTNQAVISSPLLTGLAK